MSSATTNLNEERQQRGEQLGAGYILTEEEKNAFMECNRESFMYRSLPMSVASMAITQALLYKGILTGSPRFGPLPKLAFAAFCGHLLGKMSYASVCQEKIKKLENSPLGEALRQRSGEHSQLSKGPPSELSDPNAQSFDTMFQPAGGQSQSHMQTQPRDHGYGYNQEQQVQSYMEEDEPSRKSILYEDLRLKNRENYEVTLTQKAETLLKSSPQKEPERPRKDVKKNIYGDAWDE